MAPAKTFDLESVSVDESVPAPQQYRNINHIGCCVTDIDAVMDWYKKNLGFKQIGRIVEFDRSKEPDGDIFKIYGEALNKGRFGWLTAGNHVGIELFEFSDPKSEAIESPFQFHKAGFFHLALSEPDPRKTAERLCKVGASMTGEIADLFDNGEAYCAYVKDPWGNVIELLNMSYEEQALRLGGVRKYSK